MPATRHPPNLTRPRTHRKPRRDHRPHPVHRRRARRPPRAGERVGARGDPGPPRPHRRRRRRRARLPARRRARARSRQADAVDRRRAAGESLHAMAGVPIAVKDVMATKGLPTTCGSRILRGLGAAVRRDPRDPAARGRDADPRQDQHGRVRDGLLDRALAPTARRHNPWDLERIPGGSGGGSASRASRRSRRRWRSAPTPVARSASPPPSPARSAPSRPTAASPATASSRWRARLDQAGPCTRTVLDAALLHEVIGGHDPMDSTSHRRARCRRWSRPPAGPT